MMGEIERAYEILGLEAGASFNEVMEAHRDLSDVWDPDHFNSNPRLHKKATEKLRAIKAAFELLRAHHLKAPGEKTTFTPDLPDGAELSPAPSDSGQPMEQTPEVVAEEDSGSPTASLYEEVFSDRITQAGKRLPIWFIPVPIFVLLVVVIYLVTPAEEEKQQLFEFSQVTQPSGLEEATGAASPEPGEEHPPAESSASPKSDQTEEEDPADVEVDKKNMTSSTLTEAMPGGVSSPSIAARSAAPKRIALPKPRSVTGKSAVERSKRPLLRRGALPPEEEKGEAETQPAATPQDDSSNLAFQMLKDKSTVASKLVEGEMVEDLTYREWKTVRRDGPEFWIDLIAYRSSDRTEFHLIWLVNIDTGTVTPLSQAARDLQSRVVPPQDS